MSIGLTQDGNHLTLVADGDLGAALQTANWRTGAFMAHCSGIIPEETPGALACPSFVCSDRETSTFLAAVTFALMATGPVNVGLSSEKGDGLRAVFYFPNEAVAHQRMRAAIAVVQAGGPA